MRTRRESFRREDSEPDRPEGEPPGGRVHEGAADTQGRRASLRASLGENHERITSGVYTAAANQELRVVRLPCEDGNSVIHVRCVLVQRSGGAQREAQAPLSAARVGAGPAMADRTPVMPLYGPILIFEIRPLPWWGSPKRTTTDTAMGSTSCETKIVWGWQILYTEYQVSLNDLQMRFITVVVVQPELATTHANLTTQSFGLGNHV